MGEGTDSRGKHPERQGRRAKIAIAVLCVTQFLTLCWGAKGCQDARLTRPAEWLPLNLDDPFVSSMEGTFRLSHVIPQYDQVIVAIETYHRRNGTYPPELSALVPDYLPAVPDARMKKAGSLTYAPEPQWGWGDEIPPFTFHLRGMYPFPSGMHGWTLYYCPDEFAGCNEPGDRHIRWFRLNYRWVWISSSAL